MTLLRWLPFLLGSLTVTLTVLLFWIYLFLLMLVFVLQWVSSHWETLSYIAYGYSCVNWNSLFDHLRDAPTFKINTSATVTEFCEWVQVGINLYIPHHKYQVIPHSSP